MEKKNYSKMKNAELIEECKKLYNALEERKHLAKAVDEKNEKINKLSKQHREDMLKKDEEIKALKESNKDSIPIEQVNRRIKSYQIQANANQQALIDFKRSFEDYLKTQKILLDTQITVDTLLNEKYFPKREEKGSDK